LATLTLEKDYTYAVNVVEPNQTLAIAADQSDYNLAVATASAAAYHAESQTLAASGLACVRVYCYRRPKAFAPLGFRSIRSFLSYLGSRILTCGEFDLVFQCAGS